MAYQGYIDFVRHDAVKGWAFDSKRPNQPLDIEVFVGSGEPIRGRADRFREDLLQAGYGDGRHGYEVAITGRPAVGAVRVRICGTEHYLANGAEKAERAHGERLYNSVIDGAPALPCGFSQREPGERDEKVASEIIAARHLLSGARGRNDPRKAELWDLLVQNEHAGLVRLVEAGDVKGLALYLCSLPKQSAGEGVLQGERAHKDIVATTDTGRNSTALASQDALVSLAQYLGLVRLETTEQGDYGRAIHQDAAELAARIEAEIGIPVAPPPVFSDLFGLRIGAGSVEQRSLQALYAALRVNSAVDAASARVCEIGGGFGLAAYFAVRFGLRRYTIVDLPSMLLMQYYFLRMALPDTEVRLARPELSDRPGIDLVSATDFAKPRDEKFDLVLNCDSFPEMGDEICSNYFDVIAQRSGLLLSINQEANGPLGANPRGRRQSVVSELLARRKDFSKVYRFRTWLRKGYVEELWRVAR